MKALYALYSEPEAAQRALDSLRAAAAGSELKLDPRQIVVISGEPYEGYEFTDEHATGIPYRWAVLGAVVGGTCGYSAHYAFAEVLSDFYWRHVAYARVDQRDNRLRDDYAGRNPYYACRSTFRRRTT